LLDVNGYEVDSTSVFGYPMLSHHNYSWTTFCPEPGANKGIESGRPAWITKCDEDTVGAEKRSGQIFLMKPKTLTTTAYIIQCS
jgi:hypothetical protein